MSLSRQFRPRSPHALPRYQPIHVGESFRMPLHKRRSVYRTFCQLKGHRINSRVPLTNMLPSKTFVQPAQALLELEEASILSSTLPLRPTWISSISCRLASQRRTLTHIIKDFVCIQGCTGVTESRPQSPTPNTKEESLSHGEWNPRKVLKDQSPIKTSNHSRGMAPIASLTMPCLEGLANQ